MKTRPLHSSITSKRLPQRHALPSNSGPRLSITRHRRPSMVSTFNGLEQHRVNENDFTTIPFPALEEEEHQESEDEVETHTEQEITSTVNHKLLKTFRRSLRSVLSWNRLFALLCVTGKVRFTAAQYQLVAAAIKTASSDHTALHTYKTIRGSLWDFLLANLFPQSSIMFIYNNRTRNYRSETVTKLSTDNNGMQDARDCIRLVCPSEWAKLDVITLPIYQELFESTDTTESQQGFNIETTPLVQAKDRSAYTGGRLTFWADFKGTLLPSELDESIALDIQGLKTSHQENTDFDKWFTTPSQGDNQHSLCGRVGPSWCVMPCEEDCATDIPAPTQIGSIEEQQVQAVLSRATHQLADFDRVYNSGNQSSTQRTQQHASSSRGGRRGRVSQTEAAVRTGPQTDHSNDLHYDNMFLFPGDSVVIIRPPEGIQTDLICLYVGSFIWREDGRVAERIIWVSKQDIDIAYDNLSAGDVSPSALALSLLIQAWGISSTTPRFAPDFVPSAAAYNFQKRNKGTLDDGTPYVIYRFLLYSDGFKQKKSLSDKRSVCGFYLLPLGLSHQSKCSSTAVRPLTLSSHGQDPNEVFNHIINDVVKGATEGFDSVDAYGNRVKIFLDAAAKIGDFPAMSEGSDVMGHSSDAHCSLCSVRKRKGGINPPILYTTTLHSRRLSLTRFDTRMKAIRAEKPSSSIRKHLGTSCASESEAHGLFSVRLAAAFNNAKHKTRKSASGELILNNYFDSNLSAAACPDHIFKGLITNVLTVCFDSLPSDTERRLADALICEYVQDNGLPSIDTVLNWDKHGKYAGLNNLTTSGLFCASVFAGHVFNNLKTINEWTGLYAYHLPQLLQDVIALVFWTPFTSADMQSDSDYVSGTRTDKPILYHADIHKRICKYIDSVKTYYTSGGRYKEELDKPNAHRLIELSVHTISIFKHALNVSELVMEMAHRVAKEWLERNTHADSHVTSIELAIARDWSARLLALYSIWSNSHSDEKAAAEIGLRRLLFGPGSAYLDENSADNIEFKNVMQQLREQLPPAFRDPVIDQLQGTSRKTLLPLESEYWEISVMKKKSELSQNQQNGVRLLKEYYRNSNSSVTWEPITSFAAAKLMKKDKYSKPRSCVSAHSALALDNFVSVLVPDDTSGSVIAAAGRTTGVHKYYQVRCFYKTANGENWALLHSLNTTSEYNVFRLATNPSEHLIRVTTGMRRVAAAHVCDKNCQVRYHGLIGRLQHNLTNPTFRIFTSQDGYPPHMG